MLVTAFAPMAFFLSAVYSESLYLALSVGLFLGARQGRWAWVGVLGALARPRTARASCCWCRRLMLYLYGPREDRGPIRIASDRRSTRESRSRRALADRASLLTLHRLRRDCAVAGPDARGRGPVHGLPGAERRRRADAVSRPGRVGPALRGSIHGRVGRVEGGRSRARGSCCRFSARTSTSLRPVAARIVAAGHNLMLLAFLGAAVPMIVGVWRTLPLAYGVYVIAALALPLSYPVASQPLMSLPRFLVVLFPLCIWLGAWLAVHPRARMPVLVGSGGADGVLRRPVRDLALGRVSTIALAVAAREPWRAWRTGRPGNVS